MTTNKHGYPQTIERQTDEFICVAFLRIPDPDAYQGEYGFDWLEVDCDNAKIEKVQGLDYSLVTHYFKPDNDIGDYILVSDDTERNVQNKIKEHYPDLVNVDGKYIDVPHVLLKKGQEVDLELQVKCMFGDLNGSELIEIQSNEQYKFKCKKQEKAEAPKQEEDSVAETNKKKKEKKIKKSAQVEEASVPNEQPITSNDNNDTNIDYQEILLIPLDEKEVTFILTIKCQDYTLVEEGEFFPIILKRDETADARIGGFTMMQNKPLNLKFRVIALVSDESPENDAKNLFQTFNDEKIGKFLNENSMNQAGFEIEIENQSIFDNIDSTDLDEYLYSFNKDAWVQDGLFQKGFSKNRKTTTILIRDGVEQRLENNEEVVMDVFKHDNNQIDYKVMEAYKTKLKSANKSTDYGGVIILADYESDSSSAGAFSRTDPLNHYAVLLYKANVDSKTTYAHEIGHMLGLQHTFMDNEEDSFSKKKQSYYTLKEEIQTIKNGDYIYQIYPIAYRCRKNTLADGLMNFVTSFGQKLSDEEKLKDKAQKATNANFSITKTEVDEKGEIVRDSNGKPKKKIISATKKQFLDFQDKRIKEIDDMIENNKEVLAKVNVSYIDFEEISSSLNFYILKKDDILIREENLSYIKKIIQQIIKNYLIYPERDTRNLMDYSGNNRLRFSNYQIRIMREDYENY